MDDAVTVIVTDPTLGEAKKGDLAGVFVYKFQCAGQLYLLAYEYDPETRVLFWNITIYYAQYLRKAYCNHASFAYTKRQMALNER